MFRSLAKTKSVIVVSSRPPKEVVVEVFPEDTAASILEKAGLNPRDLLMMPGDQGAYAPTDLPFEGLPLESKLHVLPDSTVGRR